MKKDPMDTIGYHIDSLGKYIDRSIVCDAVGLKTIQCTEVLRLKIAALNALEQCALYCIKAVKEAEN